MNQTAFSELERLIDTFIAHPPAGCSRQRMAGAQQEILSKSRLFAEIPDDLLQGAVPLIRGALIGADSPEAAIVFLASVYHTLLGSLLVQGLPESCRTAAHVKRLCELAHGLEVGSLASSGLVAA